MSFKRFFGDAFFASELGQAALVSIAAMVAFIVIAGIMPRTAAADSAMAGSSLAILA